MVASALMACPVMDKWEIKPVLEAKAKASWAVKVDAAMGDGDHHAEFTVIRELGAMDGPNHKATYSWSHLTVDGTERDEDTAWEVTINPRAAIVATTSDMGDDVRRMLSPMAFAYPEMPVGEGDKWTAEVRPYKGKDDFLLTYAYEVKGFEQIGDTDALKVALKLTEKGPDGMTGDGTWWIGKDGSVLQFEIKVKNWVVPMAGPEPVEAKITGKKG